MLRTLIVCFVTLSVVATTESGEQPFAVVFDSHMLDPTVRAGMVRLRWQFDRPGRTAESELEPDATRMIPSQFRSLWRAGSQRKFQFVSGRAHYFDQAMARFRNVRFVSAPSREAFDQFVRDDCARRETFSVEGTESRFTIKSPPEAASGDRPAIKWHDVSFVYQGGLFAYGDGTEVLKADLEPLATLAKEAEGKDWYMMVRPQHASRDAKVAFLKRYLPQWEMLMQRRDGEGHAPHGIRYAKFDLYRSVLQGLTEDTQSLKYWFRSPRDDAGYQVNFEVTFTKGSKSSKAIQSLVPSGSRITGHPEDALASIACNICLPDKVKSLLQASVPVLNSSLPGMLAQQAADSEVLNGHLNVQNLSGSSSLVATGQFPWLPAKRLEDIAAILDEATVEKRKLTFPSPIGIGEVPYVVSAHLKNRSTRCEFSIEQTPSEAPLRTDKVGSPRTLLSAYVNLKTLASDSGNGDARQLLELFEKVYDSHITTVTGVDSVTVRPQEMKSVLPMLSGEGDWTARLSVVAIGNRGLRIRLRVGRELYGLFDARMRRSRDARKRSLGG